MRVPRPTSHGDRTSQLDVDPLGALAVKIRERSATAAVVGLGYVGLPLIVGMHAAGFRVLGVDADERKVDLLHAPIPHPRRLRPVRSSRWTGRRSTPTRLRWATPT